MSSHRVERLAGEIKKEIASILDREIKDPRIGMVSVVAIDIAPGWLFRPCFCQSNDEQC